MKLISRSLVRDFINDALYNKEYGYFNRNVNIFKLDAPIEFKKLSGQKEYYSLLISEYSKQQSKSNQFHQLWHTPSELFKPWYGNAIGKYLVEKISLFPSTENINIYEVGAGNGTLCINILNYLSESHPELYERTIYNIIEVSSPLQKQQQNLISKANHYGKMKFHFKSIFDWDYKVPEKCFMILNEVVDNFPSDLIKFDQNGDLLQAVIEEYDSTYGQSPEKYTKVFEPASDKLIIQFVNELDKIDYNFPSLEWYLNGTISQLINPTYQNPKNEEFIPTMLFKLFQILLKQFPNHHLILSDFYELPDCIPGWNSPVVQTRYKGETVAASSLLVKKGMFDIFFPTNFEVISKIYLNTMNQSQRKASISTHNQFMKKYSDHSQARTKSGYNPLLDDFLNVKFLTSDAFQ